MTEQSDDPTTWGRVAEDGTVYVRTADGERAVGSWQAGDAAEGLAHYARRYDELATRVRLLRERLVAGTVNAGQAAQAARELRTTLPTASVVGDLAALERGLDEIDRLVGERREAQAAERRAATARRAALVEEAERIAESTEWTAGGNRLRAIVEEWKAAGDGERKAEQALWQRLSAARRTFGARRKAAYEEREKTREAVKQRKEQLIREAESLSDSTEWVETARRYKSLMTQWKAAGRAARADEDDLWKRFRAAQDTFFARRSESFAARDSEYAGNQAKKEALLARAESLEPSRDLAGAQAVLRDIQDEWERIGRVPREAMQSLEDRLKAVEERVREAGSAQTRRRTASSNPIVDQLRRGCTELSARVESARARGDEQAAARLAEELAGRQALLEHAEASLRR